MGDNKFSNEKANWFSTPFTRMCLKRLYKTHAYFSSRVRSCMCLYERRNGWCTLVKEGVAWQRILTRLVLGFGLLWCVRVIIKDYKFGTYFQMYRKLSVRQILRTDFVIKLRCICRVWNGNIKLDRECDNLVNFVPVLL